MDTSILWFNLSSPENKSNVADEFSKHCQVLEYEYSSGLLEDVVRQVNLICFEYDFPDVASLELLRTTRIQYPSVPVMMISCVHSEELAIWALRMQIREYFVSPVSAQEVKSVVEALESQQRRDAGIIDLTHSRRFALPTDCRYHNSAQKTSVMPAINYVQTHLHEKIREVEVARLCNMSPFKFSREFKRCYDMTFQEYVITLRMKKASELLVNPNVLVADVAYQVGFRDPSYFTRLFKKHKGISPSDCRGAETALS
ncbi:helix-turn-helix domain-containing protein [Aestuariicella hydrocarbonica]|uniref:Helix-turn-helix domain-containing protein n=1 Tax=Pseudomaricurvus hydrocarbonicus TaxID=1470433 RepID=A0A9E5T3G5_9GAMM|nr:helix-turn-helix domain-containing protein [Aestuariicella hydrocarbonica]NHO67158.1 helix-turn-helix domain-containing protein [Aestuariicella hydrocarbonica]